MITNLIKKAYAKITFDTITSPKAEHMLYEEQLRYIKRFKEPKDDIDRSYYKYKCWKTYFFQEKKGLMVIFNIGAMVLYPLMERKLVRNYKAIGTADIKQYDAVVENVPRLPNTDVIPAELLDKYQNNIEIDRMDYLNGALSEQGQMLCNKLKKKHFFSFYYRLIAMLKIAQFDRYLTAYQPKAILFYSYEREFTGPLQAYLCEAKNSRFISYMHGDVVYSIAFAFQRYSELYVWGKEYIELFKELRCSADFKTYVPDKLKGIAEQLPDRECRFYATYYFSCETRDCAEIIKKAFDEFKERGLICKIRPHPRYSDIEMLRDVFQDYYIEDTRNYSLSESITQSLYIIGLNTTVLSQAYFSGKKIVIDDISQEKEYQELLKKKYIMIARPHIKLSELVKEDIQYDKSYCFYKD